MNIQFIKSLDQISIQQCTQQSSSSLYCVNSNIFITMWCLMVETWIESQMLCLIYALAWEQVEKHQAMHMLQVLCMYIQLAINWDNTVYMYICMYVCMYIYMYIRTCIYMYVHMHMYVCMDICMYVCTYVRIYAHVCICMYICTIG